MVLEPCEELERAALRGEPMPELLPAPTQLWYLSMRCLYRLYHTGGITREQAQAEKHKIRQQYRLYADMLADTKRLQGVFRDRLNETEADRYMYTLALKKGCSAEQLLPIACRIAQKVTGDQSIQSALP